MSREGGAKYISGRGTSTAQGCETGSGGRGMLNTAVLIKAPVLVQASRAAAYLRCQGGTASHVLLTTTTNLPSS